MVLMGSLAYLRGQKEIQMYDQITSMSYFLQEHATEIRRDIFLSKQSELKAKLLEIRNHLIKRLVNVENLSLREVAFIFNLSPSGVEWLLKNRCRDGAVLELALNNISKIKRCRICKTIIERKANTTDLTWEMRKYCSRKCKQKAKNQRRKLNLWD